MNNLFSTDIDRLSAELCALIDGLSLEEKVEALNRVRGALHDVSPFRSEPVDFVVWVRQEHVEPNDYNPNAVAPPEMRLLAHSIDHDGYTQPVVAWREANNSLKRKVVDGAHRTRVGKEVRSVRERVHGYLPVVDVNDANTGDNDRMAATIRHNRARGKHGVEPMAGIVRDLYQKGWDDGRIAAELGMDREEVMRLKQFNGLPELFAGRNFSKAWE